jgi:hypothetical protein
MGCRIAHDTDSKIAILYCSTTDWAFGPVFADDDDHDADERAEAFLRWLATGPETWRGYDKEPLQFGHFDPRELTDTGLEAAYADWLRQEPDQWAREQAAADALFAED